MIKNSIYWLCAIGILIACSGTKNDDEKAIWLYEQDHQLFSDFKFYPELINTVGIITAGDSIRIIEQAMREPVEKLVADNTAVLKALTDMQTILNQQNVMNEQARYMQYDIDKLRKSIAGLKKLQIRLNHYKTMDPSQQLVRKVECRFTYNDPITQQTIKRDNIYTIRVKTGAVIQVDPH